MAVLGTALVVTTVAAPSAPRGGGETPAVAPAAGINACARGPEILADFGSGADGVDRYGWPAGTAFHEFIFARAMYRDTRGGGFGFGFGRGSELGDGGPAWSTDYPSADRHMVTVTQRLSNIDACEWEHPVSLADPEIRRFPFLYSLEWGWADLSEAEVRGLRGYLGAGGLLMIDDFWGSYQWANFERQIHRVLPGARIADLSRDDLLFHIHYTIDGPILQVPNLRAGWAISQGAPPEVAAEQDGVVPHLMGIYDDDGRLMVVINWNTDLGDALEWAENPYYPLKYSTFASEVFLNTIMYSMTR